jgi:hypothetical protein
MPILLQQLLDELPRDIEDRVKAAHKDHRDKIREALAFHTRMTLRRYNDDLFGAGQYETINISVAVRPGLPAPLQPRDRQEIEDQHRLALILGPYRQGLIGLRDHGKTIARKLVNAMRHEPAAVALLSGQEATIEPAWQYAQLLLEYLKQFQLTSFILNINEDVLGIYDYGGTEPKIELYWGVIGLVARDLNIGVEDLTCVVLAHEFAHAFTHVGSDANHLSWDSVQFQQAAHEVKEGLAQYFTALACRQIKVRGAYEAYEKLLEQQPKAYRVHTEWNAKPESVRLAMMRMRRVAQQQRSLELFDQFLRDAAHQLDASVAPPA